MEGDQSESIAAARRVDACCDEFELALATGKSPQIELFLADVLASERQTLLLELLGLELDFRVARGEQPKVDDYANRFPELSVEQILTRFSEISNTQRNKPPQSASQSTVSLAQETVVQQPADALQVEVTEIPKTFGRYRIVKALGQGAMGAVYLAHDQQLDRQVALKIPKFVAADSEELLARFYREARLAAALRHPNICPVFDVGEIDGRHYITMAFIEGRSLSEFVTGKRMQPQRQVAIVIRKLAIALDEAHARGVIHRDLKPANIMIDAKGEPIVMDFGLARRVSNEEAQVTHSGAILGTPAYMSPEQAEGDQSKIGPAADVYSLGVILYELLTGQRPFQGSVMSVLQQIGIGKPQPPSQRRTNIDPVLEGICLKMMSRHQADRYQSMAAVAQALTEYLKSTSGRTSQTTSVSTSVLEPSETTPDEDANAATFLFSSASDVASVLPATKVLQSSQHAADVATTWANRWRPSRNWSIAGLGLAGIGLLLAATFFLRFGNVEVKVVIDDPHLAVKFDKQTVTFEGSGSPIRLKPGEHKFIVEREGLEVETDHFTVKQNGKHVLEVSVVDGRIVVRKDDQKPVAPSLASRPNSSSSPKPAWPADAPPPAIAPFDAEQAKRHQENWAKYLKVPVEYTNSIGMKFRLIPPGEFTMGSTPEEIEEALKDVGEIKHWQKGVKSEAPQHKVILTQPIYFGMSEVTQAEYEKVMGTNPSYFAPMGMGKDAVIGMDTTSHPVEMVSWNNAADFCAKLSNQEKLKPFYFGAGETITSLDGTGYRLPSEAEWEFACRAGTATKFWIGDKEKDLVRAGWFDGNSGGRTHAAGELKANPFGLTDIYGNVYEWTLDGWDATYYGQFQEKPAINPNRPLSGGSLAVLRGGGLGHPASFCRSSTRNSTAPLNRHNDLGFRVSLAVDAVRQALKVVGSEMSNSSATTPSARAKWDGWPADTPPPAVAPFSAEQAKQHQEAWAKHLGVPVEYTNTIGMKYRLIPPGEFTMGSTSEEIEATLKIILPNDLLWTQCARSESPRHTVVLTKPTYLGVHEVTQGQYERVMGKNPSHFAPTGAGKDPVAGMDTTSHPVEMVSWNDATEFSAKLSQQENVTPFYLRDGEQVTLQKGTGYRLPTEAEWEFACRAGTTTKYWMGDNDSDLVRAGWFNANSGNRTHAVGELPSNPFGVHDVYGNVFEWVQDGWDPQYYAQFQKELALDPNGSTPANSKRVLRGGAWFFLPMICRSSMRMANVPTYRIHRAGFRVALTVDAVKAALAQPISK